jgi:CDGSH-type Zn-finger protein
MLHRSVHYNAREDMTSIQLTALPDGPERGSPVYLCRCGRSADKPFCDGSHARTGWKEDA